MNFAWVLSLSVRMPFASNNLQTLQVCKQFWSKRILKQNTHTHKSLQMLTWDLKNHELQKKLLFRKPRFWAAFVAFHFASSAFTVPLCLAFAAVAALAFRICCITSSSPAGGFLALWLLAALWLWLFASFAFSQLVFGRGFLHPQHRQSAPLE